jgi:hypothetical protein
VREDADDIRLAARATVLPGRLAALSAAIKVGVVARAGCLAQPACAREYSSWSVRDRECCIYIYSAVNDHHDKLSTPAQPICPPAQPQRLSMQTCSRPAGQPSAVVGPGFDGCNPAKADMTCVGCGALAAKARSILRLHAGNAKSSVYVRPAARACCRPRVAAAVPVRTVLAYTGVAE